MRSITVVGAGLAGAEAALTLASFNHCVTLIDAKPSAFSVAHSDANFGELVCSNSLKSDLPDTASGLLKAELRLLKSHLIAIADSVAVPAGSALAVDRQKFAAAITDKLRNNKNITIESAIIDDWDTLSPTIIASGPLTMGGLALSIRDKLKSENDSDILHFYDAAAPIVMADSLDMDKCFYSSRYNKGSADYINCPLNKEEYQAFCDALVSAKRAPLKEFEDVKVFEGCMPIEVMAARSVDALRYAMLRPVGIFHPETGEKYYAVCQLRRENKIGDMFNLVGFQTNLTFSEQRRVFGLIPALKNAEFARFGVMHSNSFINAPKLLDSTFRTKKYPSTFVAGQLSGVEGYVESIASGKLAAINMHRLVNNQELLTPPIETMTGALCTFITLENADFQPMNANFGLLPSLEKNVRDKKLRKMAYYERGIQSMAQFIKKYNLV